MSFRRGYRRKVCSWRFQARRGGWRTSKRAGVLAGGLAGWLVGWLVGWLTSGQGGARSRTGEHAPPKQGHWRGNPVPQRRGHLRGKRDVACRRSGSSKRGTTNQPSARLPGSEPGAIARLRAWCDCPAPSLARHNQRQARHFEAEQGRARLDEAKGPRVVTRSDACFPFWVRAERSCCTVPRRRSSLCFMTPAQHCLPAAFGDPCETSPSRGTPWSPCI